MLRFTSRHLHQRVEKHKHSAIGKHYKDEHDLKPVDLIKNFNVLKKCRGKLEYFIYEMLFIKNKRPSLNVRNYLHKYFYVTLYNLFIYYILISL